MGNNQRERGQKREKSSIKFPVQMGIDEKKKRERQSSRIREYEKDESYVRKKEKVL